MNIMDVYNKLENIFIFNKYILEIDIVLEFYENFDYFQVFKEQFYILIVGCGFYFCFMQVVGEFRLII